MGIRLVNAAFAALADTKVTHSGALVLLWMCKVARDDDERPIYYASREATVLALGRRIPDAPDPSHPEHDALAREREAAFRRVQDAVGSLVDSGLITRIAAGARGRAATFEINVKRSALLASTTKTVALSTTETVVLSTTETVGHARRKPSPLGREQELEKERGGGRRSPPRASHLAETTRVAS